MTYFHPAWLEYQRRRWSVSDAFRQPRLPDRYLRPNHPALAKPSTSHFSEMGGSPRSASDAKSACDRTWHQHAALLRLIADIRFEQLRHASLRAKHLAEKTYNPEQPRVPAGNPDGGQWIDGAGDARSPRFMRLAGDIPAGDLPPEIPRQRPRTSRERTSAMRRTTRFPGGLGIIMQMAEWLRQHEPLLEAYKDPPESLEKLQALANTPAPGYDIHHVVEQASAEQDGFPRSQIDASENKVRIPTMRHWEINAWYQRANDEFSGLSPRTYLKDKDWEERRRVGLTALIKFGVLDP